MSQKEVNPVSPACSECPIEKYLFDKPHSCIIVIKKLKLAFRLYPEPDITSFTVACSHVYTSKHRQHFIIAEDNDLAFTDNVTDSEPGALKQGVCVREKKQSCLSL